MSVPCQDGQRCRSLIFSQSIARIQIVSWMYQQSNNASGSKSVGGKEVGLWGKKSSKLQAQARRNTFEVRPSRFTPSAR